VGFRQLLNNQKLLGFVEHLNAEEDCPLQRPVRPQKNLDVQSFCVDVQKKILSGLRESITSSSVRTGTY